LGLSLPGGRGPSSAPTIALREKFPQRLIDSAAFEIPLAFFFHRFCGGGGSGLFGTRAPGGPGVPAQLVGTRGRRLSHKFTKVASTQKRRSLEIGATRMKTVRSLVLRTQSVVPDLHPVRRDIRRRPCGSSRRRRRRGECSRARRLACQCPETHEAKRNEHMYSQTQLIVRHR